MSPTLTPTRPDITRTIRRSGTESKTQLLSQLEELKRANAEIEQNIRTLEAQLAAAGEDSQLAQLDLQNWTQQQTQSLNMLSNVMKAMHETSMSIVQNIR